MKELTIIRPDDLHVHLREVHYDIRETVPATASVFGRALVMPNTKEPVTTAEKAVWYRDRILDQAREGGFHHFTPLMTLYLTDATTPEMIYDAAEAGVTAAKLYPASAQHKDVTTNSAHGVRDIQGLATVFKEMERVDMVLCLHGEKPGAYCHDAEEAFLETLEWLATSFPGLRIILEHVTTAKAVMAVERLPTNVAATITAHHLVLTLDDVIGGKMQPHHFCKPIPKRPEDREALIMAATGGSPRFFFGSDSAPHSMCHKQDRYGQGIPAGVYSAHVAMSVLAKVFERRDALDKLENFTSVHGAWFYGLFLNKGRIMLVKEPWRVHSGDLGHVAKSFMAGQTLDWRIVNVD